MSLFKIIICCFLLVNISFAQSYNGVVLDSKTKKGIPYANVGIPGRGYGIVCNEFGNFSIKITTEKDSDIIQVFSIGYTPQFLQVKQLKESGETNPFTIQLSETSYSLETVNVRPNDYEQMVVGSKDVGEFSCEDQINIPINKSDTAYARIKKEKGLSDKAVGLEFGNKIKIDKGQQTFIDKIRFKTCLKPNDTCVYRINIYKEGSTKQRVVTPFGMAKVINTTNVLKEPVIAKVIGKIEVQELDVSSQNIEVDDDFIIAIECIYTSNNDMNIAMKPALFGSTDLLIRSSAMADWVKVPLVDLTFVSATVTYKKKKGFWSRLFG